MDELLKKFKHENKKSDNFCKPIIFDLKKIEDEDKLKEFFKIGNIHKVVDTYEEQLKELENLKNLKNSSSTIQDSLGGISYKDGVWVYYPWLFTLVHLLNEEEYALLRNSRNTHLISDEEQLKFANTKIGFAGLNVGNPGALCIMLEGGGRFSKYADLDNLSVSNLNRFRSGVSQLGLNKVIISAQQSYEIDPYIDLELFEEGLNNQNLDKFLLKPKIDLLIEEMDNLPLKIEIRRRAKKNKIPVIMVTADGIIDVERYDIDADLPILSGHLNQSVIDKILSFDDSFKINDKIKLALEFMGADFFSTKIKETFDLVGVEIPSIPQLSEWSFLRGALLCHFARMVINNSIASGRYSLKLHDAYSKKN